MPNNTVNGRSSSCCDPSSSVLDSHGSPFAHFICSVRVSWYTGTRSVASCVTGKESASCSLAGVAPWPVWQSGRCPQVGGRFQALLWYLYPRAWQAPLAHPRDATRDVLMFYDLYPSRWAHGWQGSSVVFALAFRGCHCPSPFCPCRYVSELLVQLARHGCISMC